MHPVVALLIIAIVALIGYFVPKKYNEYFNDEYNVNALSMPLAIATAISTSIWLLFMDLAGFWYWFLLIASILLCVISILHAIYVGLQVRAGILEIVLAVIAQILATAGVIILIISVLAVVMKMVGRKKRK